MKSDPHTEEFQLYQLPSIRPWYVCTTIIVTLEAEK